MFAMDYIDEIKLRMLRHNVATNLNDPAIMTYVNMAREDAQMITKDLYPERYGDIITETVATPTYYALGQVLETYQQDPSRVIQVALPIDTLDIIVCNMKWLESGITYKSEARYSTKTEMYNAQLHAFNQATFMSPIYTLERDQTTGAYNLLLAGTDVETGVTIFDIADGGQIIIEMYTLTALNKLDNNTETGRGDQELTLPPDLEEYVIYQAMNSCMQDINDQQARKAVTAEAAAVESLVMQNYELFKQQDSTLLPSKETAE